MYAPLGLARRPRRRGLLGLGLLNLSPDLLTGALVGTIGAWIVFRGLTLPKFGK